jgi:predicted amidohydrolase YtcJ
MLYAYTRNAADVLDESSEIGTIAPGKRADLALIDRDVLTVPPDQLKDAKVLFTMFGGKLVYGHEP